MMLYLDYHIQTWNRILVHLSHNLFQFRVLLELSSQDQKLFAFFIFSTSFFIHFFVGAGSPVF
jgi:hypothetical protein